MRIFFLASVHSLHLWHMLTYFRDRGHEVFCFSDHPSSHNRKRSYRSVPERPLPEGIGYFFKIGPQLSRSRYIINIPRLRKIISEVKPDIVVARSLIGYGMLARYSRFKPYVLIGTGPDVNNLPNGSLLRIALTRKIIVNADCVWLYGAHLREIVGKLFPSIKNRLFNQPRGIDLNKFSYKNSCKKKVSTILCTRGFMSVYNQATLIKAFSILISKYPDIKLVLVGEGRTQKRCKRLAENLNLDGKIKWLGYVPQEKIVEIMKGVQLFVSVSLSDGVPASLLEAMAMGLFPVVSDIPANRQWIQDGINGYLVPATDERALADALARAIESPSFRQKSREINISLMKEKADFNKNMEIIEKLFVSVVEKRNQ